MTFEVSIRVPVARPPGLDQDRLTADVPSRRELRSIDALEIARSDLHRQKSSKLFELQLRQVDSISVTVEGRVEVRAGVGHHLDLAYVKLGARRVELARRFAAQVVADDRRGQAFVGHETVLDGVAEIDQHG